MGKLICRTDPVYGGVGSPTLTGTRLDELTLALALAPALVPALALP